MNAENFDVPALLRMAHSPVRNYVLPGLTSSLIGAPSPQGTVRIFENTRDHQETITPHSHRFDFQCWVLRGSVKNRLWRSVHEYDRDGDDYQSVDLVYQGSVGNYQPVRGAVLRWRYADQTYTEGQCYSMKHHEVHSIFFSRGAVVLFFEGPTVSESSIALEPFVDGRAIPTLEVKPWMFQRDKDAA